MKNITPKYITVCICLFLFACNNHENKLQKVVTYHENGKVKSESFKLNNQRHGEYKSYYTNGCLEVRAYFKKGIQDSIQQYYNEDGIIMQTSNYRNGIVCGELLVYEMGKLSCKQSYIIRNDSSYLNQVIDYTENGKIDIERSNYFSLHSKKDTIKMGEVFSLDVKLEASYFNMNMLVIFGDFDTNYNKSTYTDTLWDRMDDQVDFKVHYTTTKYHEGENVLKGIIHDYISYYEDDSEQDILADVRPLFFEYVFYVKAK
ncbi:toxin-antitoxin system YwqK family antitoxin [Labilibaculum antarcticum]|nr:hypothetical protein [Labilibaculum antarcticum]